MARSQGDLGFYRLLRRYDVNTPETQHALMFARLWHDLVRRISAWGEAHANSAPVLDAAHLMAGFSAFHEGQAGLRAVDYAAHLESVHHGAADHLSELAQWFAGCFNPLEPLSVSFQTWAPSYGKVLLCGPPDTPEPPSPFAFSATPPVDWLFAGLEGRPVSLVAHYDVHGLAMLALTLRYLNTLGINDVDCALGFEWTGDIGKLWKRAVPKTIEHEHEYGLIVLLDCSVHSRRPERTLKAIQRLDNAEHCHLIIIDHHPDTFSLLPDMQHERLLMVLTDVPGCALSSQWDEPARALRILGALGDKVPEYKDANGVDGNTSMARACREYNRRHVHFSPTPPKMKEAGLYPLQPLWEALANDAPITSELADTTLGKLEPEPELPLPEYQLSGSIAFVTETIPTVGRTWYALLERIMTQTGVPYACAMRILNNTRGNLLLLTRWEATHLPPIRHFIPEQYLSRTLGHPGAVWVDLERRESLGFLAQVEQNLNSFAGTPGNPKRILEELRRKIVEQIDLTLES